METVRSGKRGHIYAQSRIVRRTHHDLFAPVAQNVALQARIAFRPVVETASVERSQRTASLCLPVVLAHRFMVQHLAQQIAVPPHSHVHRQPFRCGTNHFSFYIPYAPGSRRPHLQSVIRRVDVRRHATPHVFGSRKLKDDLSGRSIAEIAPVALVLMAVPHLQATRRGVESREMQGVAMAETGIVQPRPVMVYRTRAVRDFVTTVTVHVGHTQVMVSLPCVRSPTGGIRIEHPTRRQPLAIPIKSRQHSTRIIPPAHHHARMPPVQISHSRQIPFTAVGIIVAPVFQPSARRDIVHRLQGRARLPVEHGQELRTRSDIPLPAFHRFLRPHPVVCRGIAYRMSPAVHRAVRSLGRDFSPSVAIEVVHHELGVMRPRTDVAPQVDAP